MKREEGKRNIGKKAVVLICENCLCTFASISVLYCKPQRPPWQFAEACKGNGFAYIISALRCGHKLVG